MRAAVRGTYLVSGYGVIQSAVISWPNMAVYVITGVAGFIGSALARAVLAQGDEVRGVDNLSTGTCRCVFNPLGTAATNGVGRSPAHTTCCGGRHLAGRGRDTAGGHARASCCRHRDGIGDAPGRAS